MFIGIVGFDGVEVRFNRYIVVWKGKLYCLLLWYFYVIMLIVFGCGVFYRFVLIVLNLSVNVWVVEMVEVVFDVID